MLDGAGTTVYGYTNFGALLFEDGPWGNDTVSYTYTNRLRAGLSLAQATGSPWAQSYGYDANKRLTIIDSPAGAFTYGYRIAEDIGEYYPSNTTALALAGSMVGSINLPGGSYIANTHDVLARLTGTKNSGHTVLNA
jgi:hypothetical protein